MSFFSVPGIRLQTFQVAFIIKLIAGISLGLIYTYYYTNRLTADTFKFFDDSGILFDSIYENPYDFFRMLTGINSDAPELQGYYDRMTNWYDTFSPFNDNRAMIRLNAFLRFFSLGHYYVNVVFISFLSTIGLTAILKFVSNDYPDRVKEFFLTLFLLPSVLFWGSGLLKDALVFFTLGMTLYHFRLYRESKSVNSIKGLIFLIFLFTLMLTKFYVFLILIPALISWSFYHKFKRNAGWIFLSTGFFFFIMLSVIHLLWPGFNLTDLLYRKQQAFFLLAENANAGSAISIPVLEPGFLSILMNAPYGFFTALFRPFITDSESVMMIISAIENTLILVFGLYCLFNIRIQNLTGSAIPSFCIFYCVSLYMLIGMITPILGAIVRYKAQALPFLVILFIIIADRRKTVGMNKLVNSLPL